MNVMTTICVHDDWELLARSVRCIREVGPVLVLVSRVPWEGEPGDYRKAQDVASSEGAEVVLGEWHSEHEHRLAAFQCAGERGASHMFTLDSDEVLVPELAHSVAVLAQETRVDVVQLTMNTYWKTPRYLIWPREALFPVVLLNLETTKPRGLRLVECETRLVSSHHSGVLHHLSYVGSDERIKRKLETWSHKHDVLPGWFEKVWKKWDEDHGLKNLHPTHPPAYQCTIEYDPPQDLLYGDTSYLKAPNAA